MIRAIRLIALAAVVLWGTPAPLFAQTPIDHLTLIAPAAPGGGWDQTARAMQHTLLAEHLARVVEVENIAGAAGIIGLSHFTADYRGRDDVVLVTGLVMLAAILWNDSPVTLASATPLAGLTGEPEVIVVPAASPHQTMASLLSALRADPGAVSWGGGSAGGTDQILAGLIVSGAGIDAGRLNYIAFSGGGEAVTALLGANVTVGVSGYSEASAHIQAGRLRALGLSTPARVPGLDVPTLREQGIDIDMMNWRGLVAAPGLSEAQRDRLASVIERMVHSPTWRRTLAEREWTDMYLAPDAFDAFLWSERARVDRIVLRLRGDGSTTAASTDWMFPAAIGLAAVVVALLLVRQAVGSKRHTPPAPPDLPPTTIRAIDGARLPALPWMVGGLCAYLIVLQAAGFVAASTVLFASVAVGFGSKRPARDVAIGLAVSLLLFVAFTRGLGLHVPSGTLGAWIR